jgi:Domain of unknown function (DUF4397)
MKKNIRLTLALALLCAALSTASLASSLYIVQGIPGRDYATVSDPAFPVDVLINDEVCYERGLAFGIIGGPLTLAPGSYDVKISIADSLASCTNSPLVDSTVKIDAEKDSSAVLALSSNGTPTLLTFTNNLTSVAANMGRVLFAQAADGSAVQVVLQNTTTLKLYTYTVQPGALLDVTLPADTYTVEVNQGTTTLVPSTTVVLSSQSAALLYAIGEVSNNTVSLVTKTIKDVL